MKLSGAIFDLDGTLADTLPVCFAAFRGALARLDGPAHTDEQIRALFGPSEEGMLQRVIPDRWQEGVPVLLEEYRRALVLCPRLFPAITSTLELLGQRGVRLGLVTGKGPGTTALSLAHFGLKSVFDPVEIGSPRGGVKAEAIARVVRAWGVARAEVIYVGDAVADVAAARKAGVVPIGAAWASTAIGEELRAAKAHAVFTSASDFRAWLVSALPTSPRPRTS